MNLYDRRLAVKLLGALARTLLAFVLLYIVIDLLTARQSSIVKYDIPWPIVVQYYASHVPTFMFKFQALALALLVATLLVLGKAAQDHEITALLAGGVSLGRIARVPILISLLLAVAVFAFENTLGIQSAQTANRIDREYFRRFTQADGAGPSWTNLGEKKWSCHILRFNPVALTGKDVFIHAFTENGMDEIRANRIYWDPERSQWILEDGRWASFRRDKSTRNTALISQQPAPFSESPDMLFALTQPAEGKSVSTLYHDLKSAEGMGVPADKGWVAFHTKFSRPILCFVIVWLAIPFALKIRRGGIFISFGISIALGLAYVMLYAVSVGLGTIGLLPPLVAAWLATAMFMAAGIYLFRRMPT
jgi:lipopolysaccharide export system permease protein